MKKYLLIAFLGLVTHMIALELPSSNDPFGLLATNENLDALSKELTMPPILKHGQVPVLNPGGGYAIIFLDPISRAFVDYCKTCQYPVLDVGAGYGTITLAVLKETSCSIIANDIGVENLLVLRKGAEKSTLSRLFLNSNRFPNALDFPKNSLGGIAICQVLHFLTGNEIDLGLKKIYDWLMPGGKLFIVTCSPFVKSLIAFMPTYEERVKNKERWPGQIEDYASLCPEMPNLPLFFHVMDHKVMQEALKRAGFEIEKLTFVDRRATIPSIGLDGKESIGIVAVKLLNQNN